LLGRVEPELGWILLLLGDIILIKKRFLQVKSSNLLIRHSTTDRLDSFGPGIA